MKHLAKGCLCGLEFCSFSQVCLSSLHTLAVFLHKKDLCLTHVSFFFERCSEKHYSTTFNNFSVEKSCRHLNVTRPLHYPPSSIQCFSSSSSPLFARCESRRVRNDEVWLLMNKIEGFKENIFLAYRNTFASLKVQTVEV